MNDNIVKFKLLSEKAYIPTRGTYGSAGFDFYSPKDFTILPKGDILIPLNISIEIPFGMVMIMKEKSGLAVNKKIIMGASVIDSDYRGNIHAHLFNLSYNYVKFQKGNKICQGIIIPIYTDVIYQSKFLSKTKRGGGGFGSTGK